MEECQIHRRKRWNKFESIMNSYEHKLITDWIYFLFGQIVPVLDKQSISRCNELSSEHCDFACIFQSQESEQEKKETKI